MTLQVGRGSTRRCLGVDPNGKSWTHESHLIEYSGLALYVLIVAKLQMF